MRTWRENPDSEENQRASKQHEREVFALKMQHEADVERAAELGADWQALARNAMEFTAHKFKCTVVQYPQEHELCDCGYRLLVGEYTRLINGREKES